MDNPSKEQLEQLKQVQEEKLRLRKAAFEQWLNFPTTREMFQVLQAHESKLIDGSMEDAVRTLAAVRTVRTIRKAVSDFDQFNYVLNQ